MSLIELTRCPSCNRITKVSHCNSPSCVWYLCSDCVPSGQRYLVFDPVRHRKFYTEAERFDL